MRSENKWFKNFYLLFVIISIAHSGITGCTKSDPASKKTPYVFALTTQIGVAINTVTTSNTITVSGINAATDISITGADGTYSINGGSYTNSPGTVNNGDTVSVRVTSSSNFSTMVSATLNIGGITGSFSVTTYNSDTTPDNFNFTSQNNTAKNVTITSNMVTIYGINTAVPISISGVDGTYSINGGSYTNFPGTVNNGDTVSVRVTSSASFNTTISTTLNIGGVTGSFSVTTVQQGWSVVSAGYYYTVAINKGGLYAWGKNDCGQLGDGTNIDKNTPTRIGTYTDWLSVAAGGSHTVAIKIDGSLYAWGSNNSGQIGDGTNIGKNIPTRIGTDTDWLSVAAGESCTVAIKKDGSLYSWGSNDSGQIGAGGPINESLPIKILTPIL